jgi:hypothetical protein
MKFLISFFHLEKDLLFIFFSLSFESLNSLILHFGFGLLEFSLLLCYNLINSFVNWELVNRGVRALSYDCLVFQLANYKLEIDLALLDIEVLFVYHSNNSLSRKHFHSHRVHIKAASLQ